MDNKTEIHRLKLPRGYQVEGVEYTSTIRRIIWWNQERTQFKVMIEYRDGVAWETLQEKIDGWAAQDA